ncbi:hypothetical protein HK100_009749 [Physocladia obscura]|uniref:DDB1- and CUL4-associated factor 12 beta-propeller domain-containing protein n=1 Tax=Physocladia obscura TaxID=109957 RepID=A0AAD5XF02_9FUNG|nr:hypothetical protein HK100_009749 [Physocladia obscura]
MLAYLEARRIHGTANLSSYNIERASNYSHKSQEMQPKKMKSKSSADSLATLFDFDFSLRGTETESNPNSSRKTHIVIPTPSTITTNSHSHRHIKTLFAADEKSNAEYIEMNKIFASVWLDSERIIVGTKCNRLVVLDVAKGRVVSEIPPIIGYWEGNLFVEGCTFGNDNGQQISPQIHRAQVDLNLVYLIYGIDKKN